MQNNEQAKPQFLNDYNNHAFWQMGQVEKYDQAWTNPYNEAHLAFAKKELDIAISTRGDAGTPEGLVHHGWNH